MKSEFPKITAKFFPGDWIVHNSNGEGCIVGVTPSGKLTVKFKTVVQSVEAKDCEHLDTGRNAKRFEFGG